MTTEAVITSPSLTTVLAAATSARAQCLDLLTLLSSPTSPQDPEALSTAHRTLHTHLSLLRGLNRKAILSVRATKSETAEARQEIDGLHLELQNLFYEVRHLRGEIRGCEGFAHKYLSLPMVSVEEFLAERPEWDGKGEHEVTLARIADEGEKREGLEKERKELMRRKEALAKEVARKKEELVRFDADVERWIAGQEGLGRVLEEREKQLEKEKERCDGV